MAVGLYARISLDRHDGEGVARQLDDCRKLAAERGWPDQIEYIDNDLSAYRAHRRPEYERLLTDLRRGHLSAVVAYHPDRLYRRPADLEAFIDAVQAAGADVATVRAGDVDLSTASGRMVARILGAVSRQESERIGERVSRAKRERASQGRPAGGGLRPFGLTADRTELAPLEADQLRRTAAAIIDGATIGSQVARLNAAGVFNTTGRPWTAGTLRRTLTSPHIAGLRSYRGEIVGPAAWPPILDRGTWELLRAEAASRQRGRPPAPHSLLTGLLTCSGCGRKMYPNPTRSGAKAYRCSPTQTTTGRGCGTISISTRLLDGHVRDVVGGWFTSPGFVAEFDAYLSGGETGDVATRVELDELERRQVKLAQRWAGGLMPDDAHDAAQAVLATRRVELEARLIGQPRRLTGLRAGDVAATWREDMTVDERRATIGLVARTPIVVGRGRDGAGERVDVAHRVPLLKAWTM